MRKQVKQSCIEICRFHFYGRWKPGFIRVLRGEYSQTKCLYSFSSFVCKHVTGYSIRAMSVMLEYCKIKFKILHTFFS